MKQIIARVGGVRVLLIALAVAMVGGVALAGGPPPEPDHILVQEDFTGVATQILTYLGYAVVAGLTVLVAVLAARRGWSFFRRFL